MSKHKASKLWLVFWKTYRTIEKRDRESIAGTGLCFSDFVILEALLHRGSLNLTQISTKAMLTSGSATTAADRLEKLGYIKRVDDPEDRRGKRLVLLASGKLLIEAAFKSHSENLTEAFRCLSEEENEQLLKILLKLRTHNQK